MNNTIEYGPAYAMVTVDLDPGEAVTVEAGSMVGMSDGLEIKTSIGGNSSGFFGAIWNFLLALVRKFLGGETLFVNTYSPPAGQSGKVLVAPALSGEDLTTKRCMPNSWMISRIISKRPPNTNGPM